MEGKSVTLNAIFVLFQAETDFADSVLRLLGKVRMQSAGSRQSKHPIRPLQQTDPRNQSCHQDQCSVRLNFSFSFSGHFHIAVGSICCYFWRALLDVKQTNRNSTTDRAAKLGKLKEV
jgi:hypothetical protein